MSWTKLTEDKSTWPEDFTYVWIKGVGNGKPNPVPYEFVPTYFRCLDDEDSFYRGGYEMENVTHWLPATPPQFEVEG